MLHPIDRLLGHLSDVELTQLLTTSVDHFLLDFVAHLFLLQPFNRSVLFNTSSLSLSLFWCLISPDIHLRQLIP